MDTIRIDNLVFSGRHGAYKKERNLEQEFEVSVELKILPEDTDKAARTDKLKDAVDYQKVKEIVRQTIEGDPRYLIEKLACQIAEKIMAADRRIRNAAVTVRKISVWDNGVPGVTVTRGR